MPMIRESIVTTLKADGTPHIAPIGIIADAERPEAEGEGWIIAPFAPSTTLDNLRRTGAAVANYCDDVRIFAGCVTGRQRDWPTEPAERIAGARLTAALAHAELEVTHVSEDEVRPRFHCRVVHDIGHRPFRGFNRAQLAVVEACILATRLHMLPRDKVRGEIDYLAIAIGKTAGQTEKEAWDWVIEKITGFYSGSEGATGTSRRR